MQEVTVHVVNVKLHPSLRPSENWVYIGRDMTKVSPIYEASPLGNPFPSASYSKSGALACYETWLKEKIRKKAEPQWSALVSVMHMAQEPDGVCLACWCRDPEECHGKIIREMVCQLAQDVLCQMA